MEPQSTMLATPALATPDLIPALSADALRGVIRSLSAENPTIAQVVGNACRRVGALGKITRIRSGVLYGTLGWRTDAGGLILADSGGEFFAIQKGGDDPNLGGKLRLSETNILSPGKVEANMAFVATCFGVQWFIHRSAANVPAADVAARQILRLAHAVGLSTSIVGNDDQRIGVGDMFGGPTLRPVSALGPLAAGIQGAAGAVIPAGWENVTPLRPALEIGPKTNLRVKEETDIVDTGEAVATTIACRFSYFGYELSMVQG